MKHLWKSLILAFANYTRIPMPTTTVNDGDNAYMLLFFPWVGALIGAVEYGWLTLCDLRQISAICRVCVAAALPLLVTGGFHMDGFLDTSDALHSWRPLEEKRRILKDPHIGAFAVISAISLILLYSGLLSEISTGFQRLLFAVSFIWSRLASSLLAMYEKPMEENGSLAIIVRQQNKTIVTAGLLLIAALLTVAALCQDPWSAAGQIAVLAGFSIYYHKKMNRTFAGTSGDTAGWFVCMAELLLLLSAAVL